MRGLGKRILNNSLRRFGLVLSRAAAPPVGVDECMDLKRVYGWKDLDTIIDVGANVGTMVSRYRRHFPSARIFAIEPVTDTYHVLSKTMHGMHSVICVNCAMGAHVGQGTVYIGGRSQRNSMVAGLNDVSVGDAQCVKVTTIDAFVREREIDRINLLKSDTEGYELEVMRGARETMSEHRIDVITVECTFGSGGKRHIAFDLIDGTLREHGFSLFGVYRQAQRRNGLLYCDAVFVANGLGS